MGAYHRATAAVVEQFEGHVAKYLGDGVLPILAGQKRMRTMPSGPCAPGSRWPKRYLDWSSMRTPSFGRALASPPVTQSWATSWAREHRARRRWSAMYPTWRPVCRRRPSRVRS